MSTPTPLTDEQIDALYAFVKSKYVDYYDVQLELVDHLACLVENEMVLSAELDFDKAIDLALRKAYASFGNFWFRDMVEKKEEAVRVCFGLYKTNKRSQSLAS